MEERIRKKETQLLFILIILVGLVLIGVLSISVGSVNIGFFNVIRIFFGADIGNPVSASIVLNIRIPRLLAALVGGRAFLFQACCFRYFSEIR